MTLLTIRGQILGNHIFRWIGRAGKNNTVAGGGKPDSLAVVWLKRLLMGKPGLQCHEGYSDWDGKSPRHTPTGGQRGAGRPFLFRLPTCRRCANSCACGSSSCQAIATPQGVGSGDRATFGGRQGAGGLGPQAVGNSARCLANRRAVPLDTAGRSVATDLIRSFFGPTLLPLGEGCRQLRG